MRKISRAVIPAAGLGTRMLPATKVVPKEMLAVSGKPLIQYAVEEAAASGIETIILVIGRRKRLLRKYFEPDPALERFLESRGHLAEASMIRQLPELARLRFVEQQKPLGIADAIRCARGLVGNDPFVVLLPDVIIRAAEPAAQQLIRAYSRQPGSIIAIREVELADIPRHGIVRAAGLADNGNPRLLRIASLVEKPPVEDAPSRFGVFGRYLLEPTIFEAINQTRPGVRGEIELTDALNLLCGDRAVSGCCFEGTHYDAGDPLGLLKASVEIAMEDSHLQPLLRSYFRQLQSGEKRTAEKTI
ncbi:MAG TPA: UTP--glucose-1-phosphate uridylyltransferase [Candidatus Acidoferrales bacterium]|nr:UTP--glucose-1-phosphate uridylyltransferase [Candidatus Acidoferrales bacterium]